MLPVLRLSVIGPEHDDNDVRQHLQRFLVLLLLPVRVVAFLQECPGTDAKVTDFILLAEQGL